MSAIRSLAAMKNLGAKSAKTLAAAGITTADQVRQLGAVECYLRLSRHQGKRAHGMWLPVLLGAVQGLNYQKLNRDELELVKQIAREQLAAEGL